MTDPTTDATTQVPTNEKVYLDIEFEIEDRAKTDGQFAIAHALLRLTEVLDNRLDDLNDRLEGLATATSDIPTAIDRLADAVEALKPDPT